MNKFAIEKRKKAGENTIAEKPPRSGEERAETETVKASAPMANGEERPTSGENKRLWQLYVARIGATDFSRSQLGAEKLCRICLDDAAVALKVWNAQARSDA
jgi:hypothetical protein